jgi:hypothetical protein
MHSAFDDVLWVVLGLGVLIGLACIIGSGGLWEEFGRGGLTMDGDRRRSTSSASPAAIAERDEEIRQMLEARNARAARRGELPVDVEAELRRLTAPAMDAELRGEIRDLVLARNHRRLRRGEPPLDVEAEVAREIERLGRYSRPTSS